MREGRRYLARLGTRPNAETGPARASLAKATAGAGWLAYIRQFGGTTVTAEMLEDLAGVPMALERPQLAVRVLSSAEAFRSEVGVPFKTWRGRQAT